MADKRFFSVSGPFSLAKLAGIADAEIAANADPDALFGDVAPLADAASGEVSFLDNRLYAAAFSKSLAGACVVHPNMAPKAPDGMSLLLCEQPYHGYARIARAFYPADLPTEPGAPQGGEPMAIDRSAKLGAGCRVEAGAVIGPGAEIGDRCRIGANAVIGKGVVIGDDCVIGPLTTLAYCLLGSGVVIHSGVRIGQDGFGFALGVQGHLKVPQLGRVRIGDDVEIGSNTTIDRGAGPDTVIGAGTKIDNLVQIGHNVVLGRNCIVVALAGISGSATIGDFVMIGGQTGVAGHLSIGSGVQIAAQSGVMRDIEPGQKVGGSPAAPFREWMRRIAMIKKMTNKKG